MAEAVIFPPTYVHKPWMFVEKLSAPNGRGPACSVLSILECCADGRFRPSLIAGFCFGL